MLIFALAVATAVPCPVEQAHYRLRHDAGVVLSFAPVASNKDWPSGVAAVVRFYRSGRMYDFLPYDGGTDGRQNLAHTTDVTHPDFKLPSPDGGPGRLGDMEFLAMDAHYDVIQHVPRRGDQAPAHILLPHLRDVTWYGNDAARDAAEKQFFDLVSCGPGA